MKANPSFNSAPTSWRRFRVERAALAFFGMAMFRLNHQEVRIPVAATQIKDGTIPFSRKRYTRRSAKMAPETAPHTCSLAKSAIRRIP